MHQYEHGIQLATDEIAQCLEAAIGSKFLLVRKNLLGALHSNDNIGQC
jgi:hypothetical protein